MRSMKAIFAPSPGCRTLFLLLTLCSLGCLRASAAGEMPRLTSARQVRELSPEQAAQGYPVTLRGVVTYSHANIDAVMFMQDGTAGIFIKLGEGTNFHVGDELEVQGPSASGYFMPVVAAEHVRLLGRAPLPAPERLTYEQLASGREDSEWVEVQGMVRCAFPGTKDRMHLTVAMTGQRLDVVVDHLKMADADKLVSATVHIQGVCRSRHNGRRQLRYPYISAASPSNIVVDVPAPSDVVQVPLANLLQFNSQGSYGRLVKVQGVVTEQKGNAVFIQDGGAGLYVKCSHAAAVSPGALLEVTGFPVLNQIAPIVEDATFRVIGQRPVPDPVDVKIDQLPYGDGEYDAVLVRFRARLVNRAERPDEQRLILEANNLMLTARLDTCKVDHSFKALRAGSELELTGVCLAQSLEYWNHSATNRPEAVQLLMRSSNDVKVISNPPWWTLSRLLWMLGAITVVLLAGCPWVFALDRTVRRQTGIIQQKLRREAVLEERTRIAREFHDTLEQELVAITIQLDTVDAQFLAAPRVSRQMLELARHMTRRSLIEARRSVWDLRSHLLENSDLLGALSEVAKFMAATSRVPISVQTTGEPRKLPLQVENNLLRIVQEALANALKHAHAARIDVSLAYEANKVRLRVNDDGIGFEIDRSMVAYAGHFGLLDMSERAQKIGGVFSINSFLGQGTDITVEVAENQAAAVPAALEYHEEMPVT